MKLAAVVIALLSAALLVAGTTDQDTPSPPPGTASSTVTAPAAGASGGGRYVVPANLVTPSYDNEDAVSVKNADGSRTPRSLLSSTGSSSSKTLVFTSSSVLQGSSEYGASCRGPCDIVPDSAFAKSTPSSSPSSKKAVKAPSSSKSSLKKKTAMKTKTDDVDDDDDDDNDDDNNGSKRKPIPSQEDKGPEDTDSNPGKKVVESDKTCFVFQNKEVVDAAAKRENSERYQIEEEIVAPQDRKQFDAFLRLCFLAKPKRSANEVEICLGTLPVCRKIARLYPKLTRHVARTEAAPDPDKAGEELEDNDKPPVKKDDDDEGEKKSASTRKVELETRGLADAPVAPASLKSKKSLETTAEAAGKVKNAVLHQIVSSKGINPIKKRTRPLVEVSQENSSPSFLENPVASDASLLWDEGVVFYDFGSNLTEKARVDFEKACRMWESKTCAKFVRLPERGLLGNIKFGMQWLFNKHKRYVMVYGGKGCVADIGDRSGDGFKKLLKWKSFMHISGECGVGNVAHELGHVLGMFHTHTRQDRDGKVVPDLNNVIESERANFYKVPASHFRDVGDYDSKSIMHYGPWSFSVNGKPTLYARAPGLRFGQRDAPSAGDIDIINNIYKCKPKDGGACPKNRRLAANGLCTTPGPEGAWCVSDKDCMNKCKDNVCSGAGLWGSIKGFFGRSSSSSSSSSSPAQVED